MVLGKETTDRKITYALIGQRNVAKYVLPIGLYCICSRLQVMVIQNPIATNKTVHTCYIFNISDVLASDKGSTLSNSRGHLCVASCLVSFDHGWHQELNTAAGGHHYVLFAWCMLTLGWHRGLRQCCWRTSLIYIILGDR